MAMQLCDKVCMWFSKGISFSATSTTDSHWKYR